MLSLTSRSLTRRQLLAGAGATAGAVLLGACGDGDASEAGTTNATGGDLVLTPFFGGAMFVAGTELRAPFGLADADGLLPKDRTPERVRVQLLDPSGNELGEPVEVGSRADGLPRAYFPLRATIEESGIYTARAEVEGSTAEMTIQVDEASDVPVIQPGAALPELATPTVADAQGVDPICTEDPMCSLHPVTLAEALGEGRPVALLVATPAFCQVAVCGPVLEVLLAAVDEHPDVRFLHAEVYAKPADGLDEYAPIVAALGLQFEPCLVLAGADGAVQERLDTIFDATELGEALTRLG